MKKILLFLIICFSAVILLPICVCATDSNIHNKSNEEISQYLKNQKTETGSMLDFFNNAHEAYGDELMSDYKSCLRIFAVLMAIQLISSVLISISGNGEITKIAEFCCYCASAVFIIVFFRDVSKECCKGVKDLTDFMCVSFPVLCGTLASGGYVSTAATMQINFTTVSVFLSKGINDLIMPLLYSCGILSVIDGLTNAVNISRFIALINKTIKYVIGFSLTVFAGILTFTGLSGITSDSLALRTAKYAVSNFVPVVGACLSEAVNSMINSSVILKNSIGIAGFSSITAICFYPIIKTALYVLSFKITASILILVSPDGASKTLECVSDVLEMMLGIFLVITVIFILIITIIISIGT